MCNGASLFSEVSSLDQSAEEGVANLLPKGTRPMEMGGSRNAFDQSSIGRANHQRQLKY